MNGAKERLSSASQDLLVDPSNTLFLSSASVWELAIKVRSGKLTLPASPERFVMARLIENQLTTLPIRPGHALRAASLPQHHRDPFDRMLVAQAQLEELALMTADSKLTQYEVTIIHP